MPLRIRPAAFTGLRPLRRSYHIHLPLFALTALLMIAPLAFAQPAPGPAASPETPPMSLEQAQAKVAEIQANPELKEAVKAYSSARWTEVAETIRRGMEYTVQASTYQERIDQLPARIEELQARLDEAPPDPLAAVPPDATLADLEQILTQTEVALEQTRAQKTELEEEPARREQRRAELAAALAQARQRSEVLRAPAQADADPIIAEPASALLAARQWALAQEIAWYERELRFYDMAGQSLTLRTRHAVREEAQTQRAVKLIQDRVLQLRQSEARQAATKARGARQQVADLPYWQDLAEEWRAANEAMARRRTGPNGLIGMLEDTQEALHTMEERVDQVIIDFSSVNERIKAAGLNNAVGMLLRKYRTELPAISIHRNNIKKREEIIADVQLELIQLREQQREVADVEAVLADALETLPSAATDDERSQVENVLRELFRSRQQNLDNLLEDLNDYYKALQNLDAAERELVREVSEFTAYIDERVLWIASGHAFGISDLTSSLNAARWLVARTNWRDAALTVRASLRQNMAGYALLLLLLSILVGVRGRLRAGLADLGDKASKRSATSVAPTLGAAILTIFLAIPIPLIIGAVGWLIAATPTTAGFATGIGAGLQHAALVLLLINFVRQFVRPSGLAEAHFGWPEAVNTQLRKHLRRLIYVVLPCVFLIELLDYSDGYHESLGRLLFLWLMGAIAAFFWAVLRPRTGAFQRILDHRRIDYGHWLRLWWHVFAAALPTFLAAATLAGYFYTVLRLSSLLFFTLLLATAILVVYGIILRWLVLARRRLAMEQARKRLAALKARGTEGEQPEVPIEQTEVDLAKVDVQTQRLVRSLLLIAFVAALWFIWAETLPALKILNQWELGWVTTESAERLVQRNGETVEVREDVEVPITGAHLLFAVLIALMTVAATRNLPGLLEIAVLQRLAIGAGERYAVTTIVRYILAVVGTVLFFQALGIGWSKVQWLVAAVGLGLGFGLQEIFANFVSGIIILFERPIRVGDTVTVGHIHGTVSRIRIRATTIIDFDRKELIVPNKEFVTSQVINWTLTSTTLRIVVPVGIAYGSDTRRAEQILLGIAQGHPDVLEDPAPEVWFTGFGDSALNFELRVFSPSLDVFLRIKHDVHMQIHDAFRDAGIEIAFPQRDVHVRSIEAVLPVAEQRATPLHSDARPHN